MPEIFVNFCRSCYDKQEHKGGNYVLFIVNPNSRSGKGALIWKGLEGILNERNVNIKHFLQNTEDMPFFCLSPLLPMLPRKTR